MIKHKLLLLFSVIFTALIACSSPVMAQSDTAVEGYVPMPEMVVSAETVADAFGALGFDASLYDDAGSNPHFVVDGSAYEASNVALYMDDCGLAGCQDLTFYAHFPANPEITDAILNQWNHINSKLRSRAARSTNGEIAISMTVSFLTDNDQDTLGMYIGLFFMEVAYMSATHNQNLPN